MMRRICTTAARRAAATARTLMETPTVTPPCIGIDLGTTTTGVAWFDHTTKTVRMFENAEGQRTTPSVVAFKKDGERLVGIAAKRQAVTNPRNTFFATKRLIGRRFDDPEIKRDIDTLPYKIVKHTNGDAWLEDTNGNRFSPSQVASHILMKMKETAERHLSQPVRSAVVTVPAYFNDAQRQATKDAGRIAGLDVHRILTEPTAAALAYGLDQKNTNRTIAVYDLGGGTFDISIIDINDGVFEVRATNGDTHLGGEDIDIVLTHDTMDGFKKQHSVDLRKDPVAVQRIREAAERSKIELSSTTSTTMNLPYIANNGQQALHIDQQLTRSKLEALTADIIKKTIEPCKNCMRDAGIKNTSDIHEVVMVGGMTRMPKVVETVRELFKREPCVSVNPDEAVAMGAAVQASVLVGEMCGKIVVCDVTPLSLGIETLGGAFTRIINRNTAIPVEKQETFSTAADGQMQVNIKVYQGERELAEHNKLLGTFSLTGIPPAPRGVPQIAVSFNVGADGILHVSATDQSTQRKQHITIQKHGLSEDEIKRALQEADSHKETDLKHKKQLELRNQLDAEVFKAEKLIKEHTSADKTDRDSLQAAIDESKSILNNSAATPEQHQAVYDQLSRKVIDFGGKIYAKGMNGQQPQQPPK